MDFEIDAFLERLAREVGAQRRLPEATYRLQFHAGFTFRDACQILPYLRDLGITDCYASPYLKAQPGSTHGYDITDHRSLNPEIGSAADYQAWLNALRAHGLGQILDMVPNHMGVGTNDNVWWNDVLENGPASRYAGYFDIAWHSTSRPELLDRVLLPVLGEAYGDVLEKGQLRLAFASGVFSVHYFDRRFPVAPRSYGILLGHRREELERALAPEDPALLEYQSVLTAVGHLPDRSETDSARVAERQREKEVIKRRLAALTEESAPVRAFIQQNVALFNGTPGDPHSFDLLDDLLSHQCCRLSYWRVAADEINYRRFFDINDLAALSMERQDVFEETHELVLRLLAEGKVQGLRIDHPDGLYDPEQYFWWLQQHYLLACARHLLESDPQYLDRKWEDLKPRLLERLGDFRPGSGQGPLRWPLYYVVAEKILGGEEPLPQSWAVHGTSGYDFLNRVNGLFLDRSNAKPFTRLYQEWIEERTPFPEVVYQKKFLILQVALSSELHMLAHQLDRIAQRDRHSRDFTLNSLRHAMREVIACFPVYRSYIDDHGVHEADRRHIETAVRRATARNATISRSIFRFIRDVLLLQLPEASSREDRAEWRAFAGKFQQVTAPVMAKGLEDTAHYVYNRLLSVNEVGGDPGTFGVLPETLHRYYQDRQVNWPYALSPLSTHDTKRSEDVRARLNVLSELPLEWQEGLARWSQLNEPHRLRVEDEAVPDPNDEYLLYQTLVGAWPLEPYGPEEYADFIRRIQAYMVKALHEAKVHTSWINPNAAYDEAVPKFVSRILDEQGNRPFLEDFRAFQQRVSRYGLLNSLAQTLLKITSPGVPDTYQGTELWDFSLVDPDNRRPVDYERRRRLLGELRARADAAREDRAGLVRELLQSMQDGRIKLYATAEALRCRRHHPGLFTTGEYIPLEVAGTRRDHVFGFLRRQGERCAIAAVPRLLMRLLPEDSGLPLGPEVWQDTQLLLPDGDWSRPCRNVFTGERLPCVEQQGQPMLPLGKVFAHCPVALFAG